MVTVGAVLSGGASRRMGRPKATLPIGTTPMARLVVDALVAGGCRDVVLVGGDAAELAAVGRPVVPDLDPGAGPLGGVRSALHHFAAAAVGSPEGDAIDVVVAACDLPGLDAAAVAALIDAAGATPAADVVVAEHGGRRQPAFALWRLRTRAAVDAGFAAGTRALHEMMSALVTVEVTLPEAVLVNVNRPTDLPSQ